MASESSFSFGRYGCMRERTSEQCGKLLNTFNSSLEKLGKGEIVDVAVFNKEFETFNQEFKSSIIEFAKGFNIACGTSEGIKSIIKQIKNEPNIDKFNDRLIIASILDIKHIIDQVQSYLIESDQTQKKEQEQKLKKIIGWYNKEVNAIIQKAIKSNALRFDVNKGQLPQKSQSLKTPYDCNKTIKKILKAY